MDRITYQTQGGLSIEQLDEIHIAAMRVLSDEKRGLTRFFRQFGKSVSVPAFRYVLYVLFQETR